MSKQPTPQIPVPWNPHGNPDHPSRQTHAERLASPAFVAEVVRNLIAACGPVTIPQMQAEADDQTTATPYDRDQAITEVLRSADVELYDVCEDAPAAFWGARQSGG